MRAGWEQRPGAREGWGRGSDGGRGEHGLKVTERWEEGLRVRAEREQRLGARKAESRG